MIILRQRIDIIKQQRNNYTNLTRQLNDAFKTENDHRQTMKIINGIPPTVYPRKLIPIPPPIPYHLLGNYTISTSGEIILL